MPLLTSSFVPALPPPAPPSKSWKEVKVSDLDAEVWMLSSTCCRASLSISLREVIDARDPRRDLFAPISGSNTEDADGEGDSGAIFPGGCSLCWLLACLVAMECGRYLAYVPSCLRPPGVIPARVQAGLFVEIQRATAACMMQRACARSEHPNLDRDLCLGGYDV